MTDRGPGDGPPLGGLAAPGPHGGDEPPSDSRFEVTPGDLSRATIHDDPVAIAAAVRYWFGDHDAGVARAAAWFAAVAEGLGNGN